MAVVLEGESQDGTVELHPPTTGEKLKQNDMDSPHTLVHIVEASSIHVSSESSPAAHTADVEPANSGSVRRPYRRRANSYSNIIDLHPIAEEPSASHNNGNNVPPPTRLVRSSSLRAHSAQLHIAQLNQDQQDWEDGRNMKNPREVAKWLLEHRNETKGLKELSNYLTTKSPFGVEVAKEYLGLFDFTGESLDQSLRKFFGTVLFEGETHEKDRVIQHFAQRYYLCNYRTFRSVDSCYQLAFSAILLNTDLHSPANVRKMSLDVFVRNILSLDPTYSTDMLTNLYQSIKKSQITMANPYPPEHQRQTPVAPVRRGSLQGMVAGCSSLVIASADAGSGFIRRHISATDVAQVDDLSSTTSGVSQEEREFIYREGFMQRKMLMSSESKKASSRSWMVVAVQLVGTSLVFFKASKSTIARQPELRLCMRHAFAQYEATKAHPHTLQVTTFDYRSLLLQAANENDMREWIRMINVVAAAFSKPPRATPIGSLYSAFHWPPQPTSAPISHWREQVGIFEIKINDLLDELRMLLESQRGAKRMERSSQLAFIKYELQRYGVYCAVLRDEFLRALNGDSILEKALS